MRRPHLGEGAHPEGAAVDATARPSCMRSVNHRRHAASGIAGFFHACGPLPPKIKSVGAVPAVNKNALRNIHFRARFLFGAVD
jgi:hypothetical protein